MICVPCAELASRGEPGTTHLTVCWIGCPCQHLDPKLTGKPNPPAPLVVRLVPRQDKGLCASCGRLFYLMGSRPIPHTDGWTSDNRPYGCPGSRRPAKISPPPYCLCAPGDAMTERAAPLCPTCGPFIHPREWECDCGDEDNCEVCSVRNSAIRGGQ